MTAFVIVELEPKDTDKMAMYSEEAGKTVAKFGGTFVAKGPAENLTGETGKPIKVLISFSDKGQALAWYNSVEYQKLIPLRDEGMISNFNLI